MIRKNPKPYKEGNILVHGLLKCKICGSVWNRDVNASTNIYRIAKNAINKVERPEYLCREKIDDNMKELDEKPKKIVKNNFLCLELSLDNSQPKKKKKIKNNNSVGVDASTKS
jgi:transposase